MTLFRNPKLRFFALAVGGVIGFFLSLGFSNNVSAVSLGTYRFEFYAKDSIDSGYYWTTNVLYNQTFPRFGLRAYNIIWDSVNVTGNSASIHFETNIVGQSFDRRYYRFQNGYALQVSGCATTGGTSLSLLANSISFAETEWVNNNVPSTTLTLYGDLAITGIPSGTQQIFCTISTSNNTDFFTGTNYANIPRFYFEQNPSTIIFTNNQNDAYAQAQISQNNTMIQQNQQIIEQNQAIINSQNATNEWLSDSTPPNVDTTSLGSASGWLPAGPVDSILTLPLQLLQSIINVFSGSQTCAPLSVPVPFTSEHFTLPCISALMDEIGFTPIWSIVGGVISAVLIWNTLQWLYIFVDKTLTFRENNSGLWGGL